MFILTLKKYTKLSDEKNMQLAEIFNALNSANQTAVVKQGKKVRLTSLIASIVLASIFVIAGIIAGFCGVGWVVGIVICLCSAPFIWYAYTASTWNKVENFEYLRLVDMNWVKAMLNKQETQN